jgi:hypothetical protein
MYTDKFSGKTFPAKVAIKMWWNEQRDGRGNCTMTTRTLRDWNERRDDLILNVVRPAVMDYFANHLLFDGQDHVVLDYNEANAILNGSAVEFTETFIHLAHYDGDTHIIEFRGKHSVELARFLLAYENDPKVPRPRASPPPRDTNEDPPKPIVYDDKWWTRAWDANVTMRSFLQTSQRCAGSAVFELNQDEPYGRQFAEMCFAIAVDDNHFALVNDNPWATPDEDPERYVFPFLFWIMMVFAEKMGWYVDSYESYVDYEDFPPEHYRDIWEVVATPNEPMSAVNRATDDALRESQNRPPREEEVALFRRRRNRFAVLEDLPGE